MSFEDVWAALRASYWFLPALLTAFAVALCAALVYLDHAAPTHPAGAARFFFPTSAEGSRALLSAIVSSMMTVVAVTFSVTVVALTVASQHYGPRLLNSFMRDRTVQTVLGILIGTFTYSVVVLGSIEGPSGRPLHWATMGAMALVGISVGALIVFAHHVAASLQVSEVASQITAEFQEAVLRHYPPRPGGAASDAVGVVAAGRPTGSIPAAQSGYLQRMDETALIALARRHDAVIHIAREPGRFLVRGATLAHVQPSSVASAAFARDVNAACMVGHDRTTRHDVEFAVKQLVEIALRALSPGVNEPFTAITCIDRLGECLAGVAARGAWPPERRDEDGTVRLVVPRQSFTVLLRAAFDPIRMFAGSNPGIYARLLDLIGTIAEVAFRREDLDALRHQADVARDAADASIVTADDRAFVLGRYKRAVAALDAAPGEETTDGA